MIDPTPELESLLQLLRAHGFVPLGVPFLAGAGVDEGLARCRGNVSDLLVLPDFGDATVLSTLIGTDPTHPAHLVRSVLVQVVLPPVTAARQMLALIGDDSRYEVAR
ncbi:MAG: hypothetical protein ABIQ18_12190 [Umezawaea sp.]